MNFYSLASGSKGNASLLEIKDLKILIDAGISCKQLELRLASLNIELSEIKYIFITHTHGDHIIGLKQLLKKYNITLVTSQTIYQELASLYSIENKLILSSQRKIDNLLVNVIKASHDTKECIGFVFEDEENSLVYITDTGYINHKYFNLIKNRTIYAIESNYDNGMLVKGSYHYQTKMRIASDNGHLSNDDCARYLFQSIGENTKQIILLHLSHDNNDPHLAYDNIYQKIVKDNPQIELIVASQGEVSKGICV